MMPTSSSPWRWKMTHIWLAVKARGIVHAGTAFVVALWESLEPPVSIQSSSFQWHMSAVLYRDEGPRMQVAYMVRTPDIERMGLMQSTIKIRFKGSKSLTNPARSPVCKPSSSWLEHVRSTKQIPAFGRKCPLKEHSSQSDQHGRWHAQVRCGWELDDMPMTCTICNVTPHLLQLGTITKKLETGCKWSCDNPSYHYHYYHHHSHHH